MAEKRPTTGRKRKTLFEKATAKKKAEEERSKSRVCIGTAHAQWRQLKEQKRLKTDAMVAQFLLDSYEKKDTTSSSTPVKHDFLTPPPPPVPPVSPSDCFSKITSFSAAVKADWTSTDEASESCCDVRHLSDDDAASAPVEIELVLTKSMTNKPVAGSQEIVCCSKRDLQNRPCTEEQNINLSSTRYITLTKEGFMHLMFRCLECSGECRVRGKGRDESLTFRQECLICSNYRDWISQVADIPNNKVTDHHLSRDEAREPTADCLSDSYLDQVHTTEKPSKPLYDRNAPAAKDSVSLRKDHAENEEEELGLLMETHEDSDETLTANESSIKNFSGEKFAEKESDLSSQNRQELDVQFLSSSDKTNVSADDEICTDEDESEELAEQLSDKSSVKSPLEDSDEYLPSSWDEDVESYDETSDQEIVKKAFQNTIKPVIWCIDCEAVAKMSCSIQRHKKSYCCAECVSGDSVENLHLSDFNVHFNDVRKFHLHAISKHCGTETLYKREVCQDCNRSFKVETDPNKKGHVCEYKIKPFACDVCHKRFLTEIGQKVHYRRLHRDYQHTCKYCMMVFVTKQSKLEHELSHNDETLGYTCPDCPEKFKDFVTRNEHLKTHPGKKKHTCSICSMKFSELYRYERHLRIHSGEKPYKCKVCDRSFNQDGHLKSHMRLHTGEKPFLCEHCGESFNHNISLKNHRQRQHGIDSSCVLPEENKLTGRPVGYEDQPRRQSEMRSAADAEMESCDSDSDEEQQKRFRKRKARRKKKLQTEN